MRRGRSGAGATRRYKYTRGAWPSSPRREDYVDEVAVLAVCNGRQVPLTVQERGAAIARLTRMGLPAWRVAEVLGCTPRTVTRHRLRARALEAASATWRPARPGGNPGELTSEFDRPPEVTSA